MKGEFIRNPGSDPLLFYDPRICSRKACGDIYRPRRVWQRFCSESCRYADRKDCRREAFWKRHFESRRERSQPTMAKRMRKYNNNGVLGPRFRHLPVRLRHLAAGHLHRLLERARHQGKVITRQKYASLCANAAWLARHYRQDKVASSPCLQWQDRHAYWRMERAMTLAGDPPPPRAPRSLKSGPRINEPEKLLDGI